MRPRSPAWPRLRFAALLGLAALLFVPRAQADPEGWTFTTDGAGTTGGISGLAELLPRAGLYLAVHDAKQGEGAGPRVRRLTRLQRGPDGRLLERALPWPTSVLSNDLEAATAVPGRPFEVVVVESRGAWTCLRIARDFCCATPLASGTRPGGEGQIEGLALVPSAHGLVAVWASRGEGDTPAQVYLARARTDR